MQNEDLTFNDLPQVVAQLRDEVMGMRAMLSRQQAESSKLVKENRHKPMTVDEAIEYTHIRVAERQEHPPCARTSDPAARVIDNDRIVIGNPERSHIAAELLGGRKHMRQRA